MAFGDRDLSTFFRDMGVTVVMTDGTSCQAMLDWPEKVDTLGGHLSSGIVTANPSITYPTIALPGIKSNVAVTVDGKSYVICHVEKLADGKLSKAELNAVVTS